MPGYRSLSTHLSGTAADHAREAEIRQRGGDAEMAAQLLEEALEASVRARPEMPGWICGRLASIYRSLKRYDDEVMLLERYRESQTLGGGADAVRCAALQGTRDRRSQASAGDGRARDGAPGAPALEGAAARVDPRGGAGDRRQAAAGLTPAQAELRAALLDLSPMGDARLRSCLAQLCADGHDERPADGGPRQHAEVGLVGERQCRPS